MNKEEVIQLDDENFDEEVFSGDDAVLVEFYTEDSYTCRELSDMLDRLAREFRGKVRIGRIDADENWQTAKTYEVTTVPSVLLLHKQRVVSRIEGPKTLEEYRQALNELIAEHWVI